MIMNKSTTSREAKHGQKMIEVKVRFWTDNLAPTGQIIPKHAWTGGVVRMESNPSHGITPKNPKPFNSLLDLGAIIEKVLIEHGITLHPGTRMKKYISVE